MLRVEIPDDLLIRAVSDAVERQLSRINEFSGYVDLKGACKYLAVGESQFKEWVRLGYVDDKALLYLAEVLKVPVQDLFPARTGGNRLHEFMEKLETTRF